MTQLRAKWDRPRTETGARPRINTGPGPGPGVGPGGAGGQAGVPPRPRPPGGVAAGLAGVSDCRKADGTGILNCLAGYKSLITTPAPTSHLPCLPC